MMLVTSEPSSSEALASLDPESSACLAGAAEKQGAHTRQEPFYLCRGEQFLEIAHRHEGGTEELEHHLKASTNHSTLN